MRDRLGAQAERPILLNRTYLDTFDWRLHSRGEILEFDTEPGMPCLRWRALLPGCTSRTIRVRQVPRFSSDLPAGNLRDRLAPLLEMRALLPQASVRTRIQPWRLVNKTGKVVLRCTVEQTEVLAGKQYRAIDNRLILHPLRGYDKPVNTVATLAEQIALAPANEDTLLVVLRALQRRPGDYSAKLDLSLDPNSRADAATKTILLRLLDIMVANEAGVLNNLDSEFLHDFRVAVRRTRSALGQLKGVLPPTTRERFRREFAWLGTVTTPTRDLDVYLLKYPYYRASLPSQMRPHLDPLLAFLQAQQEREHKALVKSLRSARYRTLTKNWRTLLERPPPKRSTLPNAKRPVLELANERIWRAYRRVIRDGKAIGPDSPAEALHELRKTCKKLRYLLEFFQSLYPGFEIRNLIKALKQLQDNLGEFQDLHVQMTALHGFAQQLEGDRETGVAIGMLVERLGGYQGAARQEFSHRFAKFASPRVRKTLRTLCPPLTEATDEPAAAA